MNKIDRSNSSRLITPNASDMCAPAAVARNQHADGNNTGAQLLEGGLQLRELLRPEVLAVER